MYDTRNQLVNLQDVLSLFPTNSSSDVLIGLYERILDLKSIKLDTDEQNILRIEPDKEIHMKVHGILNIYKAVSTSDTNWDMQVIGKSNTFYGLSCESLNELKYCLLADYTNKIITQVY